MCIKMGQKVKLETTSKHLKVDSKIKPSCSIVGARGYTGLELSRLLLSHPLALLTTCFATTEFKLSNYLLENEAEKVHCLPESQVMNSLTDFVFLATPAEVSLRLAPQILRAGKHVIDLSGAFRLKNCDYSKWYGFEHTEADALKAAVYGLAPWSKPVSLSQPVLVANPGCYATAISMALAPLLKRDLIETSHLVIDAKSGASGAGKKAAENLLFTEVEGECLPYKVGKHQHLPEIIEALEMFSGKVLDPHFSTHLLPTRRGITAGVYAQSKVTDLKQIERAYAEEYFSYPLVKFGSTANCPQLLSLKKVVGTARTHITYELVGNKLYIFSLIDNLVKGAAGQAIENFNRLIDAPVETGLMMQKGTL
jgi:N-acetyl-gamma-glutamyl-phosphate reductase